MEQLLPPRRRRKPGTLLLHGLARLREERGYSVRELAGLAGVSPDTVYTLEHLKRGAEPKTRRLLAKALETSIKDLKAKAPPEEDRDE